jgi:gliding motility-associated-like protein
MKKIILFLFIFSSIGNAKAQNDDCIDAIPLCTNPNFTFYATSGPGNVIDFTTSSNISNPQTNPNPPNMGCLLSGELKPQWLILTIGNAGSLEFVFGASNSAHPQAGFYDWAMWPYNPNTCNQILNNTLPPIRCNWNASANGGTGLASAANIPSGGNSGNYEAPLAVNACQKFIICISNFSGVNTLVSFQSIGTASLSCNPNCNPSYAVCLGGTVMVSPVNFANLTNPTYSLFPGPVTNSTGSFVVSPSVTTQYTTYITGTNSSNAIQTNSATLNVTVHPKPFMNPVVLNGSCSNPSTNSVNLNVTFNPSGSPNYTTTWSPNPGTFVAVNSGTAAGLTPGVTNVTITTSNGCTNTASFSVATIPVQASFVIVNPSNDYTVTCINPNVLLTASVTNGVPLTFTWFPSCTGTVSSASMNFTQSCSGFVVGTSSTGCTMTQSFTIFQDFTSPTVAVTPTVLNINCNSAASTFTGTSNLGPNVTTNWYQVVGTNTLYVGVPQGTLNTFLPGQPGIYWFESVNNLTGCRSTKSVQVTASVGIPIFTVTSSTNFTIGCSTSSVTSMQVSNVITSPAANAPCTYTFVPPAFSGTPTTFTSNPNQNNITVPGTWVVYVYDQTNNCVSSQSISIIQNTIAPNVNFLQPLSLLTCRDASMVLTGISSNSNTTITWTVPAVPSNSINPTPTASVYINSAITGATNNITALGTWTVGAVDNNNLCRATKTVQILQDVRVPKFTASAASNSIINCKDPNVLIVPVIVNTLAVALVPTYTWTPPTGGDYPGSSFNTTAAGPHTVTSMSSVNGCTANATYNVASDLTPPALIQGLTYTLDCGTNPTVAITAAISGATTGLTFNWTSFPAGVVVSNPSVATIVGTKTGDYGVVVTNTINGCKSAAGYDVIQGELSVDFTPSQINGYAPLAVTFVNNSASSFNTGSMVATWSYGNGGVLTNTYTNGSTPVTPSTIYTAAGTYSVWLKVDKGSCTGTKVKIITVEVPSKLEVPNVFTPNGDKVNDTFRLIAANLGDINATIFDRWGNKVYEVVSGTGNIAWDGKNMAGKECPAGVYFYMIKATGKDGQEYDLKGNVTLFK